MGARHMKRPVNVWLRNKDRLTLVAASCQVFSKFGQRFKGLMAEKEIKASLFVMTRAGPVKLHSWFCSDSMDLIVLDEKNTVVGLLANWWGKFAYADIKHKAKFVLELPKGTIAGSGTKVGDTIQFFQTSKQKTEMKA